MRLTLLSLFFAISLVPLYAQADTVHFLGPIVPEICHCDNYQAAGQTITSAPAYGCVMQTIQNVIRFAISIGLLLALFALIYAGFTWMTSRGNPEKISKGRTMLLNVVIGLAVLLSAWLIVDFIMKTLYSEPTGFGPWNSILAGSGEGANVCIAPNLHPMGLTSGSLELVKDPLGNSVPKGSATDVGNAVTSQNLTQAAAASAFKANGIPVSSTGACSDPNNSKCTALVGMAQNTVNQVIAIKKACNCNVTVSGGTEAGHADGGISHSTGYKVDLRADGSLDAFLKKLTPGGYRGSDPLYTDSCGNEYVRESSHWDITVTRGVCALSS